MSIAPDQKGERAESKPRLPRLREFFFAPVEAASLAVFRMAFGAVMAWEVFLYFRNGWIAEYWMQPAFHFTYPGFGWVAPWPGEGMYWHMAALGILAVLMMVGLFYRASAVLFFLGFTYTFLLEHTRYLNHFYFVCLVSLLMIFVPAHRGWSLDALRRPALRHRVVPRWSLWLLRFQLGVVYAYAGVAKLSSDWFNARPLTLWLHRLADTPAIGFLFERSETFHAVSWAGLAFDLLIVPALLWKRTCPFAFAAAVAFHATNSFLFTIGIFPWLSIAMTTLFLEPDWPLRLARKLGLPGAPLGVGSPSSSVASTPARSCSGRNWTLFLLGTYATFQLLFPLRHWLYPGDVAWTEEGHEFSWRMKLRDKKGAAQFEVTAPSTGAIWLENPAAYLKPWQAEKLPGRPELLRQFAHHLATLHARRLGHPVEVRVYTQVRLNGHPPRPIIDPTVDLAKQPYRLAPDTWITGRESSHTR